MKLRPFIFWPHLIAGVLAGVVILIMCVTGALLAYEKQIIEWLEPDITTANAAVTTPLSIRDVTARLLEQHPDVAVSGITVKSDPESALTVAAGRRTLFVDPYSGAVLGEASRGGVRQALSALREWHRWLALSDDNRPLARAITGWANLIFLFIIASGIYLWFPRQWTARHLKTVTMFNGRLSGKARDFNWHNTIGFWSAIPLFIVVLGAVPISFSWAGALLFRAVGETPPPRGPEGPPQAGARGGREGAGAGREGRDRREERPVDLTWLEGVDVALAEGARRVPDWRSMSVRRPESNGELSVAIDRGTGGQPQHRSTLVVNRATAEVVRWETFGDQSLGRRLRSILRFAHTGEVLGLPGQTVAGLVSAGGAVLVWTGLALAWRRFSAWLRRRRTTALDVDETEERSGTAA